MSILFIATYGYLTYRIPKQMLSELSCNRGSVTIIYDGGTVAVIDPGFIGQTKSAYSWIAHTLFPHMTSTLGKASLDYLILLKPNKTTLNALCNVIQEFSINTIIMPELKFEKASLNNASTNLQQTSENTGTTIVIINNQHYEITFAQTILSFVAQNRWIKTSDFFVKTVQLNGSLNNQLFSLTPYQQNTHIRKKKRGAKP